MPPTETKRRLREILDNYKGYGENESATIEAISSIESLYAEREVILVNALKEISNFKPVTDEGLLWANMAPEKIATDALKSISEGEKL